jgi:hypothetical protein
MGREQIRIRPERIIAWGLDAPAGGRARRPAASERASPHA